MESELEAAMDDLEKTVMGIKDERDRLIERNKVLREALAIADSALKHAEGLAWEVGCETEDGVHVLLEDSRGDLYREITKARAALAQEE